MKFTIHKGAVNIKECTCTIQSAVHQSMSVRKYTDDIYIQGAWNAHKEGREEYFYTGAYF